MSDSEQKNPKDHWLEKLSQEPVSEEAMQDTWTRTVFVKGKSGSPQAPAQEGEVKGAGIDGVQIGATTGPLPDALANGNPDALIGQVIAEKYRVVSFIGKGGMSSIYKVEHLQLETILALKLLDKNMWSDPTAVKRFKLEAQTVSKLTHPNLITYRDFGVTNDGQPYLVMDYIQGRTLGQKIKETRGIFLPTVLEIFEQLCEGLSVAHALGIVHRDVKPGNIMFLTEDSDKIKLVDFGIAKIVNEEGNESQQLTKTGDVFGSPLYMSPEQCMGKKLDNRSDIYSLGCVIFEAMTGRNAISGNTILDTMNKHVSLMPSLPSELRPDLVSADKSSWVDLDEFEYVVMKCLQKNPADRYKSVDEIVVDLRKIKAQEKIKRDAPVATVKNLRKTGSFDRTSPKEMFQTIAMVAYAVVGLGVIAAVVVIFVLTNRPAPSTPATPAVKARPTGPSQSIVIDNSAQSQDAVELDGKANEYMKSASWADAVDMLDTSINLVKRKGQSEFLLAPKYVNLGICYYNMGDYNKSLKAYQDAMALYKKSPDDMWGPQRKESLLGQAQAMRKMGLEKEAQALEDEAKNY